MRLRRMVSIAAVVSLIAVAWPSVPHGSAGTGNETIVTMLSSGDWVGGGQQRYFHPGNASVTVSGTRSLISVGVSGGNLGDAYHMEFTPPPGRLFVEGVYERAQRSPFREAGRPGIDIGGDGRGCNTIEGRFEIKQLGLTADGKVDRLWLVYQQNCEGGLAALFGEVRYRVPGDGGALMVGPQHLRWPDAEHGSATPVVPIAVVNTSDQTVNIGPSTIHGEDSASFEVRNDECAGDSLTPSDACLVWLRFDAAKGGQNSARLLIPESGGVTHEVALRGWVVTGTTRFTMNSEQGDYIGGGQQLEYTPQNATIAVGGGYQHVSAWIEGEDGNWWSADFDAPQGDILAPGTTYTAKRYPFNDPGAGIDVTGSGRGCNEINGTFTVNVIEVSAGGELEEVSIEYEQYCDGSTGALRGVLEYRLGGEPRPLAPDPSEPASGGDPDPETIIHKRSITLREGARRLFGRVSGGPAGCFANVLVRIQRRRAGEFRTVAKTVTNGDGAYAKRIPDKRALYRAVAPRERGPNGSICARAVSRRLWF